LPLACVTDLQVWVDISTEITAVMNNIIKNGKKEYIAKKILCKCKIILVLLTVSIGSLLGLLFNLQHKGDVFFRNVGISL
jgi:hypothetical protein